MKIQILIFHETMTPNLPVRLELEIGPDFPRANRESLPAAYVVQVRDLAVVKDFKQDTVDRGIKHKAKGLSRLLLGFKKIPLIDGNFSDPGQLRRSVRTLLANATAKGEQNLYIIGAGEDIFHFLWEQAAEEADTNDGGKRIKSGKRHALPPPSDTGSVPDSEIPSRLLLDMLGICEEPPELTQRFKGSSVEAQLVRRLILRAAESDVRVLILGDTGTGKEVVARAIHDLGSRAGKTFTTVNCSGIPRELLESELFGHEKGSFTGATNRKIGLWEVANKGTLFLDEIGDLPLEQQAKILRALEEGEIRRVGGKVPIAVDARIIAATNRDLYSMVLSGQFREDLYYRLREFLIRTPSLRERPNDIPMLAQHVWTKIVKDSNKPLPKEILENLQSYGWMGNVRELKTVLTYLHSLFGEEKLSIAGLRAIFQFYGQALVSPTDKKPSRTPDLKRVERLHHLRRADEIINACEASLRPVMEQRRTDGHTVASVQSSLRLRLNELEMLCLNPLLFQNETLFSLVYLFKGKLAYLQSLLQKDADEALRFWEGEGHDIFRQVQTAISMEKSGLMSNASPDEYRSET